MTLLLDSSALVTALSPDQQGHERLVAALQREPSPLVLSPFVLAEVDYFLLKYGGVRQELRFLAEVAAEQYVLAPFAAADVAAASAVVKRHPELAIGVTDASIVVLAGRYDTGRVFTLDERHFRALRTPSGKRFTILPADA